MSTSRKSSLVYLGLLHMTVPLMAMPHYDPSVYYRDQAIPGTRIIGKSINGGIGEILPPLENNYFQKPSHRYFDSLATNKIYPEKKSYFLKKMEDDYFISKMENEIGRGRRSLSGILPIHTLVMQVAMASLEPNYNKYNKRFNDDGIEELEHKPKGFLRFGR
ncbi:unnamed protein product [Meganyctiphanes norvegica]|uniref:Uncharacterized protein n=1 Tax=Meganyctiphanes norvegica TaxID=48144 RepID=A0AAV2Q8W4_MEGNR